MYAHTANLRNAADCPFSRIPKGLRIGCFSLQMWLSRFGAKPGQPHSISTCLRAARCKYLPILKRKIWDYCCAVDARVKEMAKSTASWPTSYLSRHIADAALRTGSLRFEKSAFSPDLCQLFLKRRKMENVRWKRALGSTPLMPRVFPLQPAFDFMVIVLPEPSKVWGYLDRPLVGCQNLN